MADEAKSLRELKSSLQNLQSTIEGTVDETFPRKLQNPWKSFFKTNDDVIECLDHILDFLEKNKDAEFEGKLEDDFEIAKKKWNSTNNVYGGLRLVMDQCKIALDYWDKAEKAFKKI